MCACMWDPGTATKNFFRRAAMANTCYGKRCTTFFSIKLLTQHHKSPYNLSPKRVFSCKGVKIASEQAGVCPLLSPHRDWVSCMF